MSASVPQDADMRTEKEENRVMSRGRCAFKQRDVTRAVKAVAKAGVSVARVEVDKEGRIIVIAGKPNGDPVVNPWDKAVADLAAKMN
jgi:hypothetical protein